MTRRLTCLSFHSVKGGVGKSTLATLAAVSLARLTKRPTWLVDMDLTGTSLADVLPLEAPAWVTQGADDPLTLERAPDHFHDVDSTRAQIERRGARTESTPFDVPFLNDFILHATPSWSAENELHPRSLGWQLRGGPSTLRVFPSSALPGDLDRILPVIFDEERSAFIEARLEWLLTKLLEDYGDLCVVFDTPPTIPGLSRSVLSLAHRLSTEPKQELSDDEGMPKELLDAVVRWRAYLVATLDHQDIRAVARWLDRVPVEHQPPVVEVLINRVERPDSARAALHTILRGDPGPSVGLSPSVDAVDVAIAAAAPWEGLDQRLRDPKFVEENPGFAIFKTGDTPEDRGALDHLLAAWLAEEPNEQ